MPEGELAFFVDGKLECEIHAVGAIAGSACTVDLKQLGAHEVEAIFSNATESSTACRTDLVAKYPTTTNVQVSIEPTAPEYLFIGDNAYGFEQFAFEVGRLRITGTGAPGSSRYSSAKTKGPTASTRKSRSAAAAPPPCPSTPSTAATRSPNAKNGTSASKRMTPPCANTTGSGSTRTKRSTPSSSTR